MALKNYDRFKNAQGLYEDSVDAARLFRERNPNSADNSNYHGPAVHYSGLALLNAAKKLIRDNE